MIPHLARYTSIAMTDFIPSSQGKLEAVLTVPDHAFKRMGIICHPNPLEGGTMDNKVVATVERTFRELGLATLRFNYRGVGQSSGTYGNEIGETEDVLTAIHWMKEKFPDTAIWLAGFSFGAYVSLQAAIQYKQIEQLISIAPAISRYNGFKGLMAPCPWLVIRAEQDELISPKAIDDWLNTLNPKPDLMSFPETSHFFHGKLVLLRQQLTDYLKNAYTL